MAKTVTTDAYVLINGVLLSDRTMSVSIDYNAESIENTTMGDTAKGRMAGLLDFSISLGMTQDHAASNVDATLFPLVGAAAFAISIRPTSGAVSATNPNYNGNVILTTYPILTGDVGTLSTTNPSFEGDGVLNRSVS